MRTVFRLLSLFASAELTAICRLLIRQQHLEVSMCARAAGVRTCFVIAGGALSGFLTCRGSWSLLILRAKENLSVRPAARAVNGVEV